MKGHGSTSPIVDRERLSELVSSIASDYIGGDREAAKATLVRYGREQAMQALGSLSVTEFVRRRIHNIFAKVGRIMSAAWDGTFGLRAKRVLRHQFPRRHATK